MVMNYPAAELRGILLINYPNYNEIDKFCASAQKVIQNLRFEAKQAIVRKVVDTIVGTQLDIKVYGHLPINIGIIATIQKGGVQEIKYEPISRDSRVAERWKEHAF